MRSIVKHTSPTLDEEQPPAPRFWFAFMFCDTLGRAKAAVKRAKRAMNWDFMLSLVGRFGILGM